MKIYGKPAAPAVEKDTQLIEDVSPQKESPPRSPSRTPERVHENPLAVNEVAASPCLGSSRKARRRIRFQKTRDDETGETSKYFANSSTMSTTASEAEEVQESDHIASSGESLRNGISDCTINSDEDAKENIVKPIKSPVKTASRNSPVKIASSENMSPVKNSEIEILEVKRKIHSLREKKVDEEKRLNFLRANTSFDEETVKSPPKKKSNTTKSSYFPASALDETCYELNEDQWIDAGSLKTKDKVSFYFYMNK